MKEVHKIRLFGLVGVVFGLLMIIVTSPLTIPAIVFKFLSSLLRYVSDWIEFFLHILFEPFFKYSNYVEKRKKTFWLNARNWK